jgi:hypothetical protein
MNRSKTATDASQDPPPPGGGPILAGDPDRSHRRVRVLRFFGQMGMRSRLGTVSSKRLDIVSTWTGTRGL